MNNDKKIYAVIEEQGVWKKRIMFIVNYVVIPFIVCNIIYKGDIWGKKMETLGVWIAVIILVAVFKRTPVAKFLLRKGRFVFYPVFFGVIASGIMFLIFCSIAIILQATNVWTNNEVVQTIVFIVGTLILLACFVLGVITGFDFAKEKNLKEKAEREALDNNTTTYIVQPQNSSCQGDDDFILVDDE